MSLLEYLSVTKHDNGQITLDDECLRYIRIEFAKLYGENDLDDDELKNEFIKKLIDKLELSDDQINFDYLNICVSERLDNDAKIEIMDKFQGNAQLLQSIPTMESLQSTKKQDISTPTEEKKVIKVDKIICIIRQKSTKPEIEDFLREFLFRQVQPPVSQTTIQTPREQTVHPIKDGTFHPLPKGLMIDLFVRQQMIDRGTITFTRPRTKFRLIEPISLVDEFNSWTFDHFHGLLDFWLTIDPTNKEHFPSSWTLSIDTNIDYMIVNQLTKDDDDPTAKHSERPSTKSLENFLRGICKNEENGMFDEWFKVLTTEENITTYSHLTNLNEKEWNRICKLPMNALKTIKSYVDQEKQMVEERKTKKNTNEQPDEDTSYSKAELRANLHMIKLYFIRQLEDQDGIETIPRLEKYCVEAAFKEMHDEGYEDDGLFDEMQLFFQPLTVTDDELIIKPKLLSKVNKEQENEKKTLEDQRKILNEDIAKKHGPVKELSDQIEKRREEFHREFREYQDERKKEENHSIQRHTELDRLWSIKYEENKTTINSMSKQLIEQEKELKNVETDKISKENLLKIIEHNLTAKKNKIDRRLVKPHRGFIMYGPPGTGKSMIMSNLAKKIGIAMLGPPLAAGELERPLVGQSEAVILDLCMRGNRLPHLMCCVSIDEIDSLAPKRDEDSSEGKVAKISVLLSVIEGIKDVPNLMFFSATNRLHMMDEAFLRRMTGKFFVGRPSAGARKRILESIPKTILQPPHIREKLATATTNFSGAALRALAGAITVHYIAQIRLKEDYEIEEEETLILADRTARQFQLFIGLDTLPRLLLHNLDNFRQLSATTTTKKDDHYSAGFHLQETCRYTGKILISLRDKCVRIETVQNNNRRHVIEDDLIATEQNLQQLLERITSYGNDRNVQLLQLIDLNLLSSKGAYDEKKIFETLKERYDECMEYKRSMIIYDLDSLIGVNKSESESSMGTSVSSSVVNQSIYIYVTSRFREAKIEANRSDKKVQIERWAVAVVRDPFLLKKFTADVDFTLTEDQQDEEEEERRRSTDVLMCVKCRDLYIENENKMGACNYHDGFVYDNLALDLQKSKPSDVIEKLNLEEFIAYKDPTQKDEIERQKTRFKYICCYATAQVGGGFNGCKKNKHGFGNRKQTSRQGEALDKTLIDSWETACYDNREYNKRWKDLFLTRGNI